MLNLAAFAFDFVNPGGSNGLLVWLAATSRTAHNMLSTLLPLTSPLLVTTAATSFKLNASIGVYNSSITPASLPWNTYNYCNAPHANSVHYEKPAVVGAELVYMNVMMRHHKRTPDNLYPNENNLNQETGWDCSNFIQQNFGSGTAQVFHQTAVPSWHPFLSQIWNGTCDGGQLTAGGLADAVQHGKDFWGIYHDKLGFLQEVDPETILFRTSTEDRTQQVAGGLLFGMDPNTANRSFPLTTQPSSIDSLPPSYPCPAANNIRNAYQSVPAWTEHLQQTTDLKSRLDATLGTGGLGAWSSWYDHFFDTFTSRTCNGHPLPCNSTGACVTQEDANSVFAIGDYEYNYIWNTAANSSLYTQLTFGVMFQELALNFKQFQTGQEQFKLKFYVGHDGSMIRLASGLGLGKVSPLRWPALGSEIVMEVWSTPQNGDFVRVLHEGSPVSGLEWLELGKFVQLLESNVPPNLYKACTST